MYANEPSQLAEHIGMKIKFYRTRRNMSQEQLAAMIFKSKSTLCKYEAGKISMDVDTLYQIACALQVELSQLVDFSVPTASREVQRNKTPFDNSPYIHMFYYDGRSSKVTRTLIELDRTQQSAEGIPCRCYMDIPSFQEYRNCRYYYTGTMLSNEMVSYINLSNQFNHTERITISILNPFQPSQSIRGIMLQLSFNPITPVAVKCLFSATEPSASLIANENLMLSKNDLKEIKRLNMMILNTDMP